MKNEDIIYLAGLLDGEGCILIMKTRPEKAARFVSPSYVLRVSIAMTHKETIEWIHNTFGGNFGLSRKAKNGWKAVWRWNFHSQKASDLLKLMLPYLITKRNEAIVAIEFQALVKSQKAGHGVALTANQIAERGALKEKLQSLR